MFQGSEWFVLFLALHSKLQQESQRPRLQQLVRTH